MDKEKGWAEKFCNKQNKALAEDRKKAGEELGVGWRVMVFVAQRFVELGGEIAIFEGFEGISDGVFLVWSTVPVTFVFDGEIFHAVVSPDIDNDTPAEEVKDCTTSEIAADDQYAVRKILDHEPKGAGSGKTKRYLVDWAPSWTKKDELGKFSQDEYWEDIKERDEEE